MASYTPLLRLALPRFGTQWVFVVCRWRWWRGDAVLATGFEAGFTSFLSSPVTHHVLPFHLWAQVCRLAPGDACSFRFSWGLGSFCLHHVLTGSFYFSKVSYSNKANAWNASGTVCISCVCSLCGARLHSVEHWTVKSCDVAASVSFRSQQALSLLSGWLASAFSIVRHFYSKGRASCFPSAAFLPKCPQHLRLRQADTRSQLHPGLLCGWQAP